MMKKAPFFVLALPLFAMPYGLFDRGGHLVGSLLFLAFGIALALSASGYRGSLPVAGGALAALVAGVLGGGVLGLGTALPSAAFFALVYAERTLRVRTKVGRGAHVALALLGGALAGTIAESYAGANTVVHVVAALVAVAAVGLPLLVDADEPLAHQLGELALDVHEPARSGLLRAANLRRATADITLDDNTSEDVDKTFRSLVRLGEARLKLQGSAHQSDTAKGVLGMLDTKVEQCVKALEKALTATMAVRAAEAAKDDGATANVEAKAAGLEEATKLLAELDAELAAPETVADAEPAAKS